MDMDRWATLARLAEEAKAALEAAEPVPQAEVEACETVMALAEGAIMDGTWTRDPDTLAAWLDRATRVAVAVCNGHELEECMYLPLDGADGAQAILTRWLAETPEGVRREAQVKYGDDGGQTDSAFVTLRKRSVHVVDTADADGRGEAEVDAD